MKMTRSATSRAKRISCVTSTIARFSDGELANDAEDLADQLGIECRCWLIEEQKFWALREGAGNGYALLLSARQALGILLGLLAEVDFCQHRVREGERLSTRQLCDLHWLKGDVLADAEMRPEMKELENHAHLCPLRGELRVGHRRERSRLPTRPSGTPSSSIVPAVGGSR